MSQDGQQKTDSPWLRYATWGVLATLVLGSAGLSLWTATKPATTVIVDQQPVIAKPVVTKDLAEPTKDNPVSLPDLFQVDVGVPTTIPYKIAPGTEFVFITCPWEPLLSRLWYDVDQDYKQGKLVLQVHARDKGDYHVGIYVGKRVWWCTVRAGAAQPVDPKTDPKPVPVQVSKLSVLIVEEQDRRGDLPKDQRSIFTSHELAKWLDSAGAWRKRDQNDDVSYDDAWIQAAFKRKGTIPWVGVYSPTHFFEGSLPDSPQKLMELVARVKEGKQ